MPNQHPKSKEAYRLLHDGILALSRAEEQGIRIDLDYCKKTQKQLTNEIKETEQNIHKTKFYKRWKHSIGGKTPNMGSNAQIANYLYNTCKYKPTKTTPSGQGSADEEALESLNIPELNQILRVRRLKKIRDTYLKGFIKEQVDGYMHTHFNLHIARTFRSSSSDPNLQNIPKRDEEIRTICRKAIVPRPGHQLMAVDYGKLEVCISACYNKDPNLIKYIEDPDTDMHRDMAQQIYFLDEFDKSIPAHKTLRNAAKNGFVFPEFYGDYYGNCTHYLACNWGSLSKAKWKQGQGIELSNTHLSDHLMDNGIKSYQKFEKHIEKIEDDFWGKRFKVYAKWKDEMWKEYQEKGYVDLLTGFQCRGLMSYNDVTNYPVQGAAFHCLLWSFIQLDKILRKKKFKTRLIGQIHDELIFDVYPPELNDVAGMLKEVMVNQLRKEWDWIIVPLTIEADLAEVDASWNDMKPYKLD